MPVRLRIRSKKDDQLCDRMGFAMSLHYWGAKRMAWKNLVQIAADMKESEGQEDGQEWE